MPKPRPLTRDWHNKVNEGLFTASLVPALRLLPLSLISHRFHFYTHNTVEAEMTSRHRVFPTQVLLLHVHSLVTYSVVFMQVYAILF